MDNKIKYLSITDVKASNNENRIVEFVATKQVKDYEGDIVMIDGMDISKIKKTKSFLWSHQNDSLPVGKIVKIWKDGKTIRGKAQMTSEEEYPFGYTVYKLINAGYINNVSLSFIPDYKEVEYKEDKQGNGSRIINKATAIEVSVVNIGMNNATSIEAKSFRDNMKKAIEDKVIAASALKEYDEIMFENSTNAESKVKTNINNNDRVIELESKIAELELQLIDKELEETNEDDIYSGLYDEYVTQPEKEDEALIEEIIDALE